MYGGQSKLGRGGAGAGRGAGAKRLSSSFPIPPPHRSSSAGSGRLSLGGSASASNPRNRASGTISPAPAVEESFSLVAGNNPPAFAMIIRLAPELVDEIRRVEAQGGNPRIKFGTLANNPHGNAIDVGGKEFRFTWSTEEGDKCDIYEERQSGEDGNGLLVESGAAWRKVNVIRSLDESTANHVKMRSEEAERKHKSRKTLILDHGNPSMKSQIKKLAAAETTPWKQFKQKKELPSKKRKIDPPPAGGPPKSLYKHAISSTTTIKGRPSSSPVPSPPEQSGPAVSPLRTVNISKSQTSVDVIPNQVTGKDKAVVNSDKELPARANNVTGETVGRKSNSVDLQSILINLLMDNPKGMSLKALEKAVGDSVPASLRQIEAIMKKIATFQSPGKYLLKPGVETESSNKRLSVNGSSPNENLHQIPAPEDKHNQTLASELDFKDKVPSQEFDEQGQLNCKLGEESNELEKIDIEQQSPDLFGEKKVSDNEGHVGSSSDSGSDSDSESDSSDSGSDSGSPSRSRSKSKSPIGSGSGSSSDSDSDASSNSKEGSDEDVDIMSDDDKEPKNKLQSESVLSGSLITWRSPDGNPMQGGNDEKQDGHEPEAAEIEKDGPDGKQETEIDVIGMSAPEYSEVPVEKSNSFSPDHDKLQEHQNFTGSLFDGVDNIVKDRPRYERSDSSEKMSKGKYKRGVEVKSDNKFERGKRLKTENSFEPPVSGSRDVHYDESVHRLPSNKLIEDPNREAIILAVNGGERDVNGELTSHKVNDRTFSGKSSADFQQSNRRSFEQGGPAKAPDSAERPHNYAESMSVVVRKHSHVHEDSPSQKSKFHKDAQYEDGFIIEKNILKNLKESGVGGKLSVPLDSHHRKHSGGVGKFKDGGQVSGSFLGTSPNNNRTVAEQSPAVNGRGSRLQREHSELELGELREPLPEVTPAKRQFDRKNSFKQSDNKLSSSDYWNSDSKGKPAGKGTLVLRKSSSPDLNPKAPSNLDISHKKRNREDRAEDSARSQQRVAQSQLQHHSRVDNVEFPQSNKVETNGNSRQNDKEKLGNNLEGCGESNKKTPGTQQFDTRRGGPVSHSIRGRKKGTSNTVAELTDGRTEPILGDGNNSERKRRDSSSDENSCSYSKYEKDQPDLKGPIKDYSQYKEYVQEYHDKYDSYCSLNKILESYRKDFDQLGKDLEYAKGRDMEKYYSILEQLKDSYRQCGMRHKRLKKIFVVLHEELKRGAWNWKLMEPGHNHNVLFSHV
ncbi:hypothetical protein G4B88_022333 [Cannabis sativa]|uniref:OCEL domain-containing protein n=1 Tax=Cannabis sativa TaxID=3483 RepID=A0A7J6HXW2_CANSA|nr:hypothetical protein G4B88_022333 [Cannabis sativa]